MASAPKNWRHWMPLDVESLLTSEDVWEMSSDEFKGYMLLIVHQWRSESGYLPKNEEVLRKKARLTLAQWEAAKDSILAKFEICEEGYSNARCRAELDKVMGKVEALRANMNESNRKREERKALENAQRTHSATLSNASYSPSPSLSLSSLSTSSLKHESTKASEGPNQGEGEGKAGVRQEQFSADVESDREKSYGGYRLIDNPPAAREAEAEVEPEGWGDAVADAIEEDAHEAASSVDADSSDSLPQGEFPGATPSPTLLQFVLSHPVKPLPPVLREGEDDWPIAVDKSTAVLDLLRAHPRPAYGSLAVTVAIDQVEALAKERGRGSREAYEYLLGRVQAYAAAVATWPAGERQFVVGVVNFLSDQVYRQDDAIWRRDGGSGGSRGDGQEILLRARAEGRTIPVDQRPVFNLEPGHIAELRAGLRRGARRFAH